MTQLQERIAQLVTQHGSLRAASAAVDVGIGYMVRLRRDADVHPGAEVLRKLGLPEDLAPTAPAPAWPAEWQALEWRPVVGMDGRYSVSETGIVRSEPRMVRKGKGAVRAVGGVELTHKIDKDGYPVVTLHRNSRPTSRHVHRLVLEAFAGPCPAGMESCHNDGNPLNCSKGNLRWDTRPANANDKMGHGTMIIGTDHHRAKLTEAQVLAIRADSRTAKLIAGEYGISDTHVCSIRNRKSWKWL